MSIIEIITKKRDGGALSDEEIRFFVHGVHEGTIADYQISALLMAIFLNGMDERETTTLTMEMASTGDVADLSGIDGIKVDKHSTGGVGDLTTLVAMPIAAACGVKVAKMSGRSLGHTGGTLDKMWSIKGCKTELTMQEFIDQVQKIGCALIGQTGALAPVDKKLYALRDVTATVESLPLIVSSILSKKIAAGCDAIVLDVKTGSGALMQMLEDSKRLAREMVKIGKLAGRRVVALVTDMDEPLGRSIGNALEVQEAVQILKGEEQGRAKELCLAVAANMISLGLQMPYENALQRAQEALASGKGFEKLKELVAAQGGDTKMLDDTALLPKAAVQMDVFAHETGYLFDMDTRALGLAAGALGAGRMEQDDQIDYAVGIELCCRVGDFVEGGRRLATVHARNAQEAKACASKVMQALHIYDKRPEKRPLIFERFD